MKISNKQSIDTGMALALVCLLLRVLFPHLPYTLPLAILFLLLAMIWPMLLKPLAVLWLGLSAILGSVMSRLLLSTIYYLILVPIGLIVQLVRKDAMKIKAFGSGNGSLFIDRQHTFEKSDLDYPY